MISVSFVCKFIRLCVVEWVDEFIGCPRYAYGMGSIMYRLSTMYQPCINRLCTVVVSGRAEDCLVLKQVDYCSYNISIFGNVPTFTGRGQGGRSIRICEPHDH